MPRIRIIVSVALVAAFVGTGAAQAQTSGTPSSTRSPSAAPAADPSKRSTADQVEAWTKKQWDAARKEWAKDKKRWADCRKQSRDRKLEGRKSWPYLYKCMTE